jgi:hypothetical protein
MRLIHRMFRASTGNREHGGKPFIVEKKERFHNRSLFRDSFPHRVRLRMSMSIQGAKEVILLYFFSIACASYGISFL